MSRLRVGKTSPFSSWPPLLVFVLVLTIHAFYIRHLTSASSGTDLWADNASDTGPLGFGLYLQGQDYFLGFSYALGAGFAAWAISRFVRQRQAVMAAGAVGSLTIVGVLMAAGCFLLGCCGSPMLAVYLSLFGAKALGVGKPLMALITLFSVGCGYWYLSSRSRVNGCGEACVGNLKGVC